MELPEESWLWCSSRSRCGLHSMLSCLVRAAVSELNKCLSSRGIEVLNERESKVLLGSSHIQE